VAINIIIIISKVELKPLSLQQKLDVIKHGCGKTIKGTGKRTTLKVWKAYVRNINN
jgi:hypothetical protein